MTRFDSLAAGWDVSSIHIERTRNIAQALRERVPLAGRSVLEVGAGTGLLSFAISPEVRSVLATDPSQGMLDVLFEKVRQSGAWNIEVHRCGDDLDGVQGSFGLVMLQMALHHISDPAQFVRRAASLLESQGFLAVADLDPEDGSFHGADTPDVHPGFERTQVLTWFSEAGLEPVSIETVHVVRRKVEGQDRDYPVFLAVARKA